MWNTASRATLIGGALLSLWSPCAAQMTPCAGVSGGTDYKVLVDEVKVASANTANAALPIELISNSVEGALEQLRGHLLQGSGQPHGISYLTCTGRHPTNVASFDKNLVKSMVANHAILELWGTLFPAGQGQHTLAIRYVMFPVASLAAPPPSGMTSTEGTILRKATPEQVMALLTGARADLPVFFITAAGAQAFADRDWDQAVRYLCQARTKLKGNAGQQDLWKFADQLAGAAAQEAQRANAGVVELMSGQQAKDYCAFATTR